MTRVPATILTGFLGAGKTTLLRHILSHAAGRRIAVIVNEFGAVGIDGETLRACGLDSCGPDDIIELANGCLCCTVAEDFLPTMERLLDRAQPPEHVVIETSGLALPKPLLRAFNWPSVRSRMTVDGVVTVVDAPAVAAGRFADDPEAVARARAADPALEHDNPLAEVFEDQLLCADLVVINKADLVSEAQLADVRAGIARTIPRAVKIVRAAEGRVAPGVLLGLGSAAEDELDQRASHHDDSPDHEHDDFESLVIELGEIATPEALVAALRGIASTHDVLRMKGFVAIEGRPLRLAIQGVGQRFRQHYDRAWEAGEARQGQVVLIGLNGLDRAAVSRELASALPAALPAIRPAA